MPERVLTYQELRNSYRGKFIDLVARHPQWDPARDARIVVFNRCANIFNTASLFRFFQISTLADDDFWLKYFGAVPSEDNRRLIYLESESFINVGLIQSVFSSYETALRLFVRAIDPTACTRGAAEFQSIYRWLFKRLGLQPLDELFEILRMLRNTIHNNGIYISRTATDATSGYKGETFEFKHGRRVEFQLDFVVSLYKDVADALVQMVEAREIATIGLIEDLNAKV